MKKPLNKKTYTILQNGNKHLSKSKNSCFSRKTWRLHLEGWRYHPNLWFKKNL